MTDNMPIFSSIKILIISLCVVLLYHAQVVASDVTTITSVIYPPIVSKRPIPHLGYGVCRDIVTAAFKASDIAVNYELLPMSRNVWSIVEEKKSVCLGSLAWFKNSKYGEFVESIDILNVNYVAFYKKQRFPRSTDYISHKELSKYRVGGVRGSGSQQTLDNAQIQTELVKDIRTVFKMLEADRIDFGISIQVTGNYLVRELFPNNSENFSHLKIPILRAPLSLFFLKEHQEIKEQFLQGLTTIARNGTYQEILTRYYGNEGIPKGAIPAFLVPELPSYSQ